MDLHDDLAGAKILVVDDNPTNIKVLVGLLEPAGYNILAATSGERALRTAARALPDLILLDVMMPEMDGYEVCKRLKQDEALKSIPVIFVTAHDQDQALVAGFEAGGVDYIAKPFRGDEVLMRMRTHLRLSRLTRELLRKNVELEATHRELDESQNRLIASLEKELQTAHDMQMRLMPTEAPTIAGLEVAGRCVSASHVGGDFYQYFEQDGGITVSLADVTGHAMDAAIPAVMFSGILDKQMEIPSSLDERVAGLNRSLYRALEKQTFVCLSMVDIDAEGPGARLATAGCPYPLHYHAVTGQITECGVDVYPLGVRPDTAYQVQELQLAHGDYLVLHSDGFAEATDTNDEPFGFDRTIDVVQRGCAEGLSSEALIDRLIAEVKVFTGDAAQSDDMTCVVVKVAQ